MTFFHLFDVNGRIKSRQQPHVKPVNIMQKKDKQKLPRFVKVRRKKIAGCPGLERYCRPVKRPRVQLLLTNVLFDCHKRSLSHPQLRQRALPSTQAGTNGRKHVSPTTCTSKHTV